MTDDPQLTVVNVDDQEPQRYVKTRDLRLSGFSVIEATTGAEALRLIERHRPLVVLLDVQLPDIDGYQVCRYVKQKWPEVMVLMTSATFTTSEQRTRGLDFGADSYLVQPAEPLELGAAVNALLRIGAPRINSGTSTKLSKAKSGRGPPSCPARSRRSRRAPIACARSWIRPTSFRAT